jgi:hypothetical protein
MAMESVVREQFLEDFLERLRTDRPFREEVRRQVLTEDLLALPERFEARMAGVEAALQRLAEAQLRTEERIGQLEVRVERLETRMEAVEAALQRLAEAQLRTEERVERVEVRLEALESALQRLAEAQLHTEERVERVETRLEGIDATLQRLTEAQLRTAEELRWLANWQRGESGHREGERYEHEILRRALALFNGGEGGAPDQPWVRQRLMQEVGARVVWGVLEPEEDPSLADLLWWKGEQLAVVEVSVQVNGQDVARAAQRATTLRQAGARVVAVVIGDDWATLDSRDRALVRQVEWKVGADLSEGFVAIRQVPPT